MHKYYKYKIFFTFSITPPPQNFAENQRVAFLYFSVTFKKRKKSGLRTEIIFLSGISQKMRKKSIFCDFSAEMS